VKTPSTAAELDKRWAKASAPLVDDDWVKPTSPQTRHANGQANAQGSPRAAGQQYRQVKLAPRKSHRPFAGTDNMNLWLRSTHREAVCGDRRHRARCLVGVMTVTSIIGRALWARPVQGDVEITQFGIALCISLCLPWCQCTARQHHRGLLHPEGCAARHSSGWTHRRHAAGRHVALLAWRTAVGAVVVREAGETS
jgi:hypothetical protein